MKMIEKKLSKLNWVAIVAIFILLISSVYLFFLFEASRKVYSSDIGMIEISEGESKIQIADKLYRQHAINSKVVFLIATLRHKEQWKYGIYQAEDSYSINDWITNFSLGRNLVIKITVPEGWRREQIARALESKGITNEKEFEIASTSFEGKLLPATYYFKPNSVASDVVAKMTEVFADGTSDLNFSANDLILASIVERETDRDTAEKSIIAGIYKNRLAISMKLQADPTGIYANDTLQYSKLEPVGQKAYKFWKVMSISELNALHSSYNTYYSSGLPPAPICNPSVETIKATINYTKTSYFYFQHINGKFYPAKTYEEHLQNSRSAN